MGLFSKIVKSVVGGVTKAAGTSKALGTGFDPLSVGTSIASEYALRNRGGGGGRGKIGRSPEVKAARLEKRTAVQEAKPSGSAAVKTARQEGRLGIQEARQVARTRIQQEKETKQASKKGATKMFKEGGSVMKPKMKMVTKGGKKVPAFAADGVGKMKDGGMMDKQGRALGRKTADAKGRAMKKGK